MGLADDIQAGFPAGTALPVELRRLCGYVERVFAAPPGEQDPQIGSLDIRPAANVLLEWFRGDAAAASYFAAFGTGPSGSVLAFWLHTGSDARTAPVVHLGPDCLNFRLLAADVRSFLTLLGAGYGELGFDDLSIPPEELELAPQRSEKLRAFLHAEFGITPPSAGADLAREARERHPDLGAWVRDWQQQAFPEPPAEKYRRELRDLMVASMNLDLLWKHIQKDRAGIRRDVIRVAEFISDVDLKVRPPAEGVPRVVMQEVADDILGCVERAEWDRLLPTEWAVRTRYSWWYEKTWLGKAWHCLWSRERPPKRRAAAASR